PTDRPVHPRSRCVSCLFSRDPWGCARLRPPKTGLTHGPVCTLPFPVNAIEFFALGYDLRPDPFHDTVAIPALEPTMHGAVVAKRLGKLVPLATRAHSEEDTITTSPSICAGPPWILGWRTVFHQNGLDDLPKII